MLEEHEFWHIVGLAKHDRPAFWARLYALSRDELIELRELHNETAATLKYEPYSDAMGDNRSEDAIDDIATWVVLQGKEYFDKVVEDPSLIPENVRAEYMKDPFHISGAVIQVHRERFGVPPWADRTRER